MRSAYALGSAGLVLPEGTTRLDSHDALTELALGRKPAAYDRSIDVHVSRIRAAIEDDPKHPRRILTVRGVGYKIDDPE